MGFWEKNQKTEKEEHTLEGAEKKDEEMLNDLQIGFKQRMQQEQKRFLDVCDTEYWFCVCFTSRDQKEEFLKSIGMNVDEKYIDGREFSKAVKRPIKTNDMKFHRIIANKDYLSDKSMNFEK